MKTDWHIMIRNPNKYPTKVPAGWSTVADVSASLGCCENRVRAKLAPAIAEKLVEQRFFSIYDAADNLVKRVSAYRKIKKPASRKARRA